MDRQKRSEYTRVSRSKAQLLTLWPACTPFQSTPALSERLRPSVIISRPSLCLSLLCRSASVALSHTHDASPKEREREREIKEREMYGSMVRTHTFDLSHDYQGYHRVTMLSVLSPLSR